MKKDTVIIRKPSGIIEENTRESLKSVININVNIKYLVQSVMSYGVEIWGWEEKEILEKVMMDYVRWIFRLYFCTPRYIIMRELAMDKLKIGWGIRARRYEEKIRKGFTGGWVRECWEEKQNYHWEDRYGSERESYYNRNGWGIGNSRITDNEQDNLETEIIDRERDVQMQWEDSRIGKARYNKKYKELIDKIRGPAYLRVARLELIKRGDVVRALAKLRCGNLGEANKYWLEEGEEKRCIFCKKKVGIIGIEHYVRECEEMEERFNVLGEDKGRILERLWSEELDETKGKVIRNLWKDRDKILKELKEKDKEKKRKESG
ncbi:hypothetical protein ALC62_15968 [Cyphomyrmex costatus]|uniref:Uncharacterized protein n=1 Tax=Cyphomyrmex costatus TaxID=456900 RepID=A0A195BZ57_9HYME|nr:hypothetical protein ALC62_15968 [Cyphomyrmex costatus]